MNYCGVDIGKLGGICIQGPLNGDVFMETYKMPRLGNGDLDIEAIHAIFIKAGMCYVVFENITPLHKASKSVNFDLAYQKGIIEALAISLGYSIEKVYPKIWQEEMFRLIPPMRKKDGTADTKAMAYVAFKKIYPFVVITKGRQKKAPDGIIDAILMVEWLKNKHRLK